MSSPVRYQVKTVNQAQNDYKKFIRDWWIWIYGPDPEANSDRGNVTFMRDDSIGTPDDPTTGDIIEETIKRPVGTNIFFPVYHVHICTKDAYPGGGECTDIPRCKQAADDDLAKLQNMWAKISIDDGPALPIPTNLNDHFATSRTWQLTVGPNNLRKEPQYILDPTGSPYKGVARGTYMLLKNFKKGKYVLDFGGIASNFKTHSVYTMHVE